MLQFKLFMAAAGNTGDQMALSSFAMTHDIYQTLVHIKKLEDGRYGFIGKFDDYFVCGQDTSKVDNNNKIDHALWILDFTSDGYPRWTRDMMGSTNSPFYTQDFCWDWNFENRYFADELRDFGFFRSPASASGTSILENLDGIDTTFTGEVRESGSTTTIQSGETFYFKPLTHTPSYVIYWGKGQYTNNKDANGFEVYNKTGTLQFQFNLYISTTYSLDIEVVKELSNGNLLVLSGSLGGAAEITTSGTIRWAHSSQNHSVAKNSFVETDSYIYLARSTALWRYTRSTGALQSTSTFVAASDLHDNTTGNAFNQNNSDAYGNRIAIDDSGSIYMASYLNKHGCILKIESDQITEVFDIYDNRTGSDALNWNSVNCMIYSEGKILFNMQFSTASDRNAGKVTALVTGAFDPTISSTLSADLHTNIMQADTDSSSEIQLRIERKILSTPISLSWSTINNSTTTDMHTFTSWNTASIKLAFDANTNEVNTSKDYFGPVKKFD
jgi:hypothetical protein